MSSPVPGNKGVDVTRLLVARSNVFSKICLSLPEPEVQKVRKPVEETSRKTNRGFHLVGTAQEEEKSLPALYARETKFKYGCFYQTQGLFFRPNFE